MSMANRLNNEFPDTASFAAAVAAGVQDEVQPLKDDIAALKQEIQNLRAEIASVASSIPPQ